MEKQIYIVELGISYVKNKIYCCTLSVPGLSIIKDIKVNNNSKILFYYLSVHRTEMIGFDFNQEIGKEINSGDYDLGVELNDDETCEFIIVTIETNINNLMIYQSLTGLGRSLGVDSSIYLNNTCKCPESKNSLDSFKYMVEKNLNFIKNKDFMDDRINEIKNDSKNNMEMIISKSIENIDSIKNKIACMLENDIQNKFDENFSQLPFNDIIQKIKIIIDTSFKNYIINNSNIQNNSDSTKNSQMLNDIYIRLLEIHGREQILNNNRNNHDKDKHKYNNEDNSDENENDRVDGKLNKLKYENNKLKEEMQMLKEKLFNAEEYIDEQNIVIQKYMDTFKKRGYI